MIGFTAWRDEKIIELERTNEIYRERNKQLEDRVKELEEIELRSKIMQMLIGDDPAIDELLECEKIKDNSLYGRYDDWMRASSLAQANALGRQGLGMAGAGGLLGLAGF